MMALTQILALQQQVESLRQQLDMMKVDLMIAQGDAVRLTGELAKCEQERNELVEALKLIAWCKDSRWQQNCANEALAGLK